ncbi:Aste57867_21635 [Aphanomyces stellatus]|uniref:Aste57867_21635 protein n=1 Tax=Aphanomyces stellatus TaxID=120398 RepID=A0A485LK43_9STRA|nr:hypothetical protein As57867_021566 [Aphanomyces stellatus]VFT98305.1 Aste57867_21635 [Aphanomyces stellatus]
MKDNVSYGAVRNDSSSADVPLEEEANHRGKGFNISKLTVAICAIAGLALCAFVFVDIQHHCSWESTQANIGLKTTRSAEEKTALAIAFVENQMTTYHTPGIGLSIVYNHKPVLARGFGTTKYGSGNDPVTLSTLFQIGSYSKTFIALAIGKLVDEKRAKWLDPVKQHLPWFTLLDKYAERYTTLGDLLGMNSVFGDHEGDLVWLFGIHDNEKKIVKALGTFNTTHPLRPGYAYSNMNYEILSQVIQSVTNQTWSDYIKATFWDPLGMNDTVGCPSDSPSPELLSYGHFYCNDKVIGPFNQLNDSMIALRPGTDKYIAAGTITSSVADLTKFSLFLLGQGSSIFSSPAIVSEMITGHTVNQFFEKLARFMGYSYSSNGNAITAGYGFDVVGDVMFGHHYFDKGGDTAAFHTRNGFVPSEGLGVVLLANAQSAGGRTSGSSIRLDLMRSYIMGIFLDVPTDELDDQFNTALATLDHLMPSQPCDSHYFDGQPWATPGLVIPESTKQLLVGTYQSVSQPAFYGSLQVFRRGNTLQLKYGDYFTGELIATADSTTFIWAVDIGATTASISVTESNRASPVLNFGGETWRRVSD